MGFRRVYNRRGIEVGRVIRMGAFWRPVDYVEFTEQPLAESPWVALATLRREFGEDLTFGKDKPF